MVQFLVEWQHPPSHGCLYGVVPLVHSSSLNLPNALSSLVVLPDILPQLRLVKIWRSIFKVLSRQWLVTSSLNLNLRIEHMRKVFGVHALSYHPILKGVNTLLLVVLEVPIHVVRVVGLGVKDNLWLIQPFHHAGFL